jgi:hypothetical protein
MRMSAGMADRCGNPEDHLVPALQLGRVSQ